MDAFIGTILPWPVPFAPDGWLLCQGQTLQITSYQALFALIGTYFGGNGSSNFQLPNLCGRVPLGAGVGSTGTNYIFGKPGGSETLEPLNASGTLSGTLTGNAAGSATLTAANMPLHSHTMGGIPACSGGADTPAPGPTVVSAAALYTGKVVNAYSSANPDVSLKAGGNTGDAGQSTPTAVSVSVPLNNVAVNMPGANLPVTNSRGGQPSNMQPYVVMNYIICYNGIFPSRP
jgi:microcystin-dependent protein